MSLKKDCHNNKLTIVALHKFVQERALDLGLNLEGPLAGICERAQVNRPQVYERKTQIEEALEEVELAGPGRPVCPPTPEEKCWRLREQVLRFRLNHPGAMVLHIGGHTSYSDSFIRFILDLRDEWEGSHEQFCEQVEIPYQTISNWSKKKSGAPV
jgi:hypothetical protein